MISKLKRRFRKPYRFLCAMLAIFFVDMTNIIETSARQWNNFVIAYQTKATFGVVLAMFVSYHDSWYSEVFSAMFWLIVLDILTRWLAISNKFLLDHGFKQESITTVAKFKAIGLAFMAKQITTANMTGGLISKVAQFSILLGGAYWIDTVVMNTHLVLPITAVETLIGYICYSEILSIVENMRDSGVAHMDKLAELLSTNIFNKLKK